MNQAEIMSRVLFLYRLKRTWHSPWSKVVLISAFITAELLLVSVYEVIKNAWQVNGFSNILRYFFSALLQTDLTVQILLAGLALVAGLLARDVFQNFRSHRHFVTV